MALLHLIVLFLLHTISPSGAVDPLNCQCGNSGNYTAKSTFQSNMNILFTSLANSSSSGFSTNSVGSVPDLVYGLALCRGDVNSSVCNSCLKDAVSDIQAICPYNKGGIIWFDYCLLRYSNLGFFNSVDTSGIIIMYNTQNATNPDGFNTSVTGLIDKISYQAAYNSSLMFATGVLSRGRESKPELYGLVQCTRDLSKDNCYQCLQQTYQDYVEYFKVGGKVVQVKRGGRILGKNCNFRYEDYSFYNGKPTISLSLPPISPTLPPSPPPRPLSLSPPPPQSTLDMPGEENNTGMILAIVIPLVLASVLIFVLCFCFYRRRSAKKIPDHSNLEEVSSESLFFDLSVLKGATANFSDENKLGAGGFGAVYKGTLPSGQLIAVKRLSASSNQGVGELKNELLLVAKLQHKNLVRLRGVCLEEEEKLLIYEYMPNRSLDTFLFDPIKCTLLNWERRLNIIKGIARGLVYLHEESHLKVIHRDLKTSNVLLDEDLNPKIADFGLARLFGGDDTQGITSRVAGTYGYMAPEYALRGQISTKLDVYSFGVLVIEIITGRKNSTFHESKHGKDLLSDTWEHWSTGKILEIVDPSLGEHCSENWVFRCIQIGLLCAQEIPVNRPSMSSVTLMLNTSSMALEDPSQPTFFGGAGATDSNVSSKKSYTGSSESSTSKSVPVSANDVSITELQPR